VAISSGEAQIPAAVLQPPSVITLPLPPETDRKAAAALIAALDGFAGRLEKITAAASSGSETSPELDNAMYDFRRQAREALGSRLKDRAKLNFKTHAALLRRDIEVLRRNCGALGPESADKLLAALSVLSKVPVGVKKRAPDLPASVAGNGFKAKIKSAGTALESARAKLAGASPEAAGALRGTMVKNALAELRTALDAYKFDKGRYPDNLSSLVGKYLESVPALEFPGQRESAEVRLVPRDTYSDHGDAVTGVGGWLYITDRQSVFFGKVFVNSRQKSPSGKFWFRY
jgi:hypothetical protein